MAVTCKDLDKLTMGSILKLVGGSGGLDRVISWPYIKSVDSISEWVHGGELLFIIGAREDISEKGLLKTMEEAAGIGVSGVVMLVGTDYIRRIPKAVIIYANEHKLPLFRMPYSIRLIDVTQELCKMILEDRNAVRAKTVYNEVSALELLMKHADRDEILTYCYQRLQPLSESDRLMNTEYVFTLKNYLKCNNDLLHTSQKMYIHRNTMINRMKKINELLGENVNEPEVRCDFQNIFHILDYYGM